MNRIFKSCFVVLIAVVVTTGLLFSNGKADIETAIYFFEVGEFNSAKEAFTEIIELYPENSRAAYFLGRIFYQECDMDLATDWLKKAVDLEEGISEYHLWLGRAYARKGLKSSIFKKPFYAHKTKRNLEKAVEIDSANALARHDLILYYMRVPGIFGGGKGKANAQAEALRRMNPWEGFKAFGQIHLLEEKYEAAEKVYLAAIDQYPNEVQFYISLADVYVKTKAYEKALEICQQAAQQIPSAKASALYQQGVIYQEMDDYPVAHAIFKDVISDNPDFLPAHAAIGQSALHLKIELEFARECLKIYIECHPFNCNPELVWAYYRLGRIYELQGEFVAASQMYGTALILDSGFELAEGAMKLLEKNNRN